MKCRDVLKIISRGGFSYINPKIKKGYSPIHGRGVFAREDIKKGEILTLSGGIIITKKQMLQFYKEWGKIIKDYTVKVWDNLFIFSSLKDTDLEIDDLVNHSCNPNAGIKGQIALVAMRDIKRGEEITYDYAMTDSDPMDYFVCHCGAKNCRKVVTGNDWKRKDLQRRYRGYFSLYLEEKIRQLKKR